MEFTEEFKEWLGNCPYDFEYTDMTEACVFLCLTDPNEDEDE